MKENHAITRSRFSCVLNEPRLAVSCGTKSTEEIISAAKRSPLSQWHKVAIMTHDTKSTLDLYCF